YTTLFRSGSARASLVGARVLIEFNGEYRTFEQILFTRAPSCFCLERGNRRTKIYWLGIFCRAAGLALGRFDQGFQPILQRDARLVAERFIGVVLMERAQVDDPRWVAMAERSLDEDFELIAPGFGECRAIWGVIRRRIGFSLYLCACRGGIGCRTELGFSHGGRGGAPLRGSSAVVGVPP